MTKNPRMAPIMVAPHSPAALINTFVIVILLFILIHKIYRSYPIKYGRYKYLIEDKKAWTTLTVIHAHIYFVSDLFYIMCIVMAKLVHSISYKRVYFNFVSSKLFQFLITVRCVIAQLLFNADKLVVLSHTIGTTHRTRLDLTRVSSYGNISNRCILGFT